MTKEQAKRRLEALLAGIGRDIVVDVAHDGTLSKFQFRATREITFASLSVLSQCFGTRKINLGSETRHGGYCETCAYSYAVTVVFVNDVTAVPSSDDAALKALRDG